MKLKRLLGMVALTLVVATVGTMQALTKQEVTAHASRTSRTFPKRLRGTWYTYMDHKYYRMRITAKKMSYGGYVSQLHSRKKTFYSKVATHPKHPNWIISRNLTYKGQAWTWTYGWYQGAGAGEYYSRVTCNLDGHRYAAIQLASGAGIWTDGYAYHSKALAKRYAHTHFQGDRGRF